MDDLGQLLREARDQKEVSLEEVEEATRIRQKFLQSLEEGDYGALPAETYVKGFLRTYALYLEFDPEELIALYEKRVNEGKAALPQPGFFHPMDLSMTEPSWLTPDLVIGALLIVTLSVFGCWATWRYFPPTVKTQLLFWQAAATATPTATPTTIPTSTSTNVPTSAPTAMPTATPTPLPTVAAVVEPTSTSTSLPTGASTNAPTNTPTPRGSTGIEVELNIIEYTWLRVLVDGEEAFIGPLEAGATQTWRGRESVALRCGNAGGVEAAINGESLGLLGERGEVADIEWLAEGIAPAPVTPTP